MVTYDNNIRVLDGLLELLAALVASDLGLGVDVAIMKRGDASATVYAGYSTANKLSTSGQQRRREC